MSLWSNLLYDKISHQSNEDNSFSNAVQHCVVFSPYFWFLADQLSLAVVRGLTAFLLSPHPLSGRIWHYRATLSSTLRHWLTALSIAIVLFVSCVHLPHGPKKRDFSHSNHCNLTETTLYIRCFRQPLISFCTLRQYTPRFYIRPRVADFTAVALPKHTCALEVASKRIECSCATM